MSKPTPTQQDDMDVMELQDLALQVVHEVQFSEIAYGPDAYDTYLKRMASMPRYMGR